MSQIILIQSNQTIFDLLSINLSTFTGSQVIPKSNADEAIELLNILPSVDLIICEEKVGGEDTAAKIVKYLTSEKLDTTVIATGSKSKELAPFCVIIEDSQDWESVISSAAKVLGITPMVLAKKIKPDYLPIAAHFFDIITRCCCDVFIRIKKGPDEFQFVKRIHAGDTFSRDSINKYTSQGLRHFYIARDMEENFANFMSDQLVQQLSKESISIEERIELTGKSYDLVSSEIKGLGFTSATVQLTDSIVESMIKSVEKSPQISSLLYKLINSDTSYLYLHSHMTFVIASETLKALGNMSAEDQLRLSYASFFQNITLIDHEELAKVSTYPELEKVDLNEEDWDLVFNHALESAVIFRSYPEVVPLGIDTLILQHHGSTNGKGYSTNCGSKIPFLSRVFVIACEFVKEFLSYKESKSKNNSTPGPIVANLYHKYQGEEMAQVIKGLELALKKNKND